MSANIDAPETDGLVKANNTSRKVTLSSFIQKQRTVFASHKRQLNAAFRRRAAVARAAGEKTDPDRAAAIARRAACTIDVELFGPSASVPDGSARGSASSPSATPSPRRAAAGPARPVKPAGAAGATAATVPQHSSATAAAAAATAAPDADAAAHAGAGAAPSPIIPPHLAPVNRGFWPRAVRASVEAAEAAEVERIAAAEKLEKEMKKQEKELKKQKKKKQRKAAGGGKKRKRDDVERDEGEDEKKEREWRERREEGRAKRIAGRRAARMRA